MSKLLDYLESHPLAVWKDMVEAGIHRRDVVKAVEDEVLTKMAHGIYAGDKAMGHPELEFAVAVASTGGVIGRFTAAGIHQLIDKDGTERVTEVFVPRNVTTRRTNAFPLRLLRTTDPEALVSGVETRTILGIPVGITNPARTVVDLVKGPVRQHAVTALAAYVTEDRNLNDLYAQAETFGVTREIRDMVQAAQQVMSRPGF